MQTLALSYLDQKRNCDENRKHKHSAKSVKMKSPSSRPIHKRDRNQSHNDHHYANAYGGIFSSSFG